MKRNSILNYFTSSVKPKNSPAASNDKNASPSVLQPTQPKETKATPKVDEVDVTSLKEFDLVWAKLDGYPWWPSLVCRHPTTGSCFKASTYIHVQFFDNPPSRSWIKNKSIKVYTGATKGPIEFCADPAWRDGCKEAEEALKLDREERKRFLVEHLASSDEDEDSFNDSSDRSKENMEVDESRAGKSKRRSKSPSPTPNKRRRIVLPDVDSESEDEYKPTKADGSEESDSASSGVPENDIDTPSESEVESPVKQTPKTSKKAKTSLATPKTPTSRSKPPALTSTPPTISGTTKSRLSLFAAPDSSPCSSKKEEEDQQWNHLKYDFIKPEKIRDKKKLRPNDEGYNPRTLHVPEDFKQKLTPGMRQWWDLKADHYDVVLFFKVGKFYELYHMDAVTGVNELGLLFMKGDFAHSGFPEISYGRFADALVQKGYKVARVEQTETPDMMQDRVKHTPRPTKFDKVVKREICQITSTGTRTCSVQDAPLGNADSFFLTSVVEKELEGAGCERELGVCFVDSSVGQFHLSQFRDDRHCSRLRTLFAHRSPVQILYERGGLGKTTQDFLRNHCANMEPLAPNTESWSPDKTLKYLAEKEYFKGKGVEATDWPQTLRECQSDKDALGLSTKSERELCIKALGGLVWYLVRCKIDQELLSMKQFEWYQPPDVLSEVKTTSVSAQHMILDDVTLANLEVVMSSSGSHEGTLLEQIDHCCTPFGKRTLREWLLRPLSSNTAIAARLDAIEDIHSNMQLFEDVRTFLRKLPDLQRLLAKIHTAGNAAKSEDHPDSRAVFYEEQTYSKRKIADFLSVLSGFKDTVEVHDLLSGGHEFKSPLLQKVSKKVSEEGHFPDGLPALLKHFDEAFDQDAARKDGRIIPSSGVDEEYDSCISELNEIEDEAKNHLKEQCRHFGCKVVYFGNARNRYQLEVPDHAVKHATTDHELSSQRKGFRRYYTRELKDLLTRTMQAEDRRDAALRDIARRIFEKFDKSYKIWSSVVRCIAVLDSLLSLATFSQGKGAAEMCRPTIVDRNDGNVSSLEIVGGRHPCLCDKPDFIPNDTDLGKTDGATTLLLTGPNMGGKSTLMRQTGAIIILAQVGCFVPAESCTLTPFDRIFTRLGASDRIMGGESTFYVELNETAAILRHATKHSFALLDELGRGTATFDGTAIASAVAHRLAELGCLCIFSTHYHSLVGELQQHRAIQLGHMSCMVEDDEAMEVDGEDTPKQECVTFLYKLAPGACPKSHGFNAARLAGLPSSVVVGAQKKAIEFEATTKRANVFSTLWNSKEGLTSLIPQLAEVC